MKTRKATKNPTEIEQPQEDQDRTPEQPGPGEESGKEKSLTEKREAREGSDQKEKEKTLPICKENPPNDTESRPEEKRPAPAAVGTKEEKQPGSDWKTTGRRLTIGRPRRYKTPEDLLTQAEEYLKACYNDKGELIQPITITGMCNFLGTTRRRLLDYENGDLADLKEGGQGDDDGFRHAIKRVKHVCEQYAETHGFFARNPAFAIFALKNYGWKDTQTVETTTTEIHTIDPETRQILQDYIDKLAHAQRMTVIDITPAPTRELVPIDKPVDKCQSG